jgi:Nucleotidyltransferase domain.
MIYMEDRHKKIVLNILKKYPYAFYAYGSRVKGTHRPTSDLDICFMEPISLIEQSYIEEDFEESDLPFQVDVSDYNLMSESFQNHIKKDFVVLQKKS